MASSPGSRRTPGSFVPVLVRAAVIVLVGAVAYANALAGPFLLDDQESIVTNEQIRQLWPPSVVLAPARELPVAGRPVANVSFALNYAMGGLDVRGYHIVNVALHILCALLLFGIVRRALERPTLVRWTAGRSLDLGFAVALIWLVHPLATEAVDYLTQRTELLMGLCYLLTLYASIRALGPGQPAVAPAEREAQRRESKARRPKGGAATANPVAVTANPATGSALWPFVAVVACFLGVGAKESIASAPLMVMLFDRVFAFDSWKDAWRRRWPLYVALMASWFLLAGLMWSGPRSRSTGFHTNVSPWEYLLNQCVFIVRYLRLTIWPRGLVVNYGFPAPIGIGTAAPYAAVLVVLGLLTVVALVRRPALGFLGAWFFVTLAPTSSIVPIATEVAAERRMYLPLAALVVLAVAGAVALWDRDVATDPSLAPARKRSIVPYAALAIVTTVLATITILRNQEYASNVNLAKATMARWPSGRARHWLGAELLAAGRKDEGIVELTSALAEDPSAEYTLGVALFQQGRFDDAIAHLREYLAHESMRIEVPDARELLGRALDITGQPAAAADEFRQVLRMVPSRSDAHRLLADSLMKQEAYAEAATQYRQYLRAKPDTVDALTNLGIASAALGQADDAIGAFSRVAALDPKDGGARRNLARALLDARRFDEAAVQARQAVLLRPDDSVSHDELGLALAGQNHIDDAIVEMRRAFQLDPNDPDVGDHLATLLRIKDGIMRHP